MAYSPDGRRLAYAHHDATVRVVDTATGREVAVLRGHDAQVSSLAFSPDSTLVATGGGFPDNGVRLWRAETGERVAALDGHRNSVNWVGFSPDGARLASASADQTGRLWEARTGRFIAALHGHRGGST